MSDESVTQVPSVFSSKERAALVAKALSEAARRARFSTKSRRGSSANSYRARRGERIARLLQIAAFILFVAVPGIVASIYFGLIAADQYTADARFTVRGGLPSGVDSIGSLTGAPSVLIIQDTQVIMNFIESRAIVEDLMKSVHLTKLYQDPDADFFSRLWPHQSIEKIVAYWKRHVDLSVQMPAGIVEMTVRAFRPEDAVNIANAVLASSEQLVNNMNDQMRADAVELAKRERERAQENLAKARSELQKARNEEGILSADQASTAVNDLLTQVRGQLLKEQQDYDSERRFVNADAPQLRNLQTRIDAAKQEIAKLQASMTSVKATAGGDKPLSGAMSRLDYASLNNEIADRIYAGAVSGLEQATLASDTKLMYINAFVRPVLAEEAKYPRRAIDIALVLGAGLAAWAAALGLISLLRRGLV